MCFFVISICQHVCPSGRQELSGCAESGERARLTMGARWGGGVTTWWITAITRYMCWCADWSSLLTLGAYKQIKSKSNFPLFPLAASAETKSWLFRVNCYKLFLKKKFRHGGMKNAQLGTRHHSEEKYFFGDTCLKVNNRGFKPFKVIYREIQLVVKGSQK